MMTTSQTVTLYTSIPPVQHRKASGVEYGETYQRECINSWISAGFRVASINPRSELASLSDKYPQVEFLDSGSEDVRTGIQVFFQKLAATGERISGIINADCYLPGVGSFADELISHSPGSLILLRRLAIDNATLRPSGVRAWGFDGFVFDTSYILRTEGCEDWKIGEPCWDFWFPVAMHFAGARLCLLDAPILFHLDHDLRWDAEEDTRTGKKLWNALKRQSVRLSAVDPSSQILELCGVNLSDEERNFNQIWSRLVPWLHEQPETICLADARIPGNFFNRMLMGLENSQEAVLRDQLERVTFSQWFHSKRAAVRRLRDRRRARR